MPSTVSKLLQDQSLPANIETQPLASQHLRLTHLFYNVTLPQ